MAAAVSVRPELCVTEPEAPKLYSFNLSERCWSAGTFKSGPVQCNRMGTDLPKTPSKDENINFSSHSRLSSNLQPTTDYIYLPIIIPLFFFIIPEKKIFIFPESGL